MNKKITVLTIMYLAFFLSLQAQKFTDFRFTSEAIGWGSDFEGVINDTDRTITFETQQWIENIAELRATFTLDENFHDVKVDGIVQENNITTNDFRKKVVYAIGNDVEYTVIFVSPQASGLPVIKVETQNGANILNRENWVNMETFTLSDPNNEANDILRTGLESKDRIRGRGNSTWGHPKKPYRLRFRENTSFFGLPARENWVLLAEFQDPTFLMNAAAFQLGRNVFELPYTCSYQHVQLYLNGAYQGVYGLTEHRQADPNNEGTPGRVKIDTEEGWFVELDSYWDEDPKFRTENYDLPIMIKTPENLDAIPSIKADWDELCDLMASPEFPESGYRDLINISSFVDFLMANEIVRNSELWHPKSTFSYKDENKIINMGPLWDFDWAYNYSGSGHTYFINHTGRSGKHSFFQRFFQDPIFLVKFKERWNEKYEEIVAISTFLDESGKNIRTGLAEDSKRWNIPSGGYRADYDPDHAQQIEKMTTWWNNRCTLLNTELNKVELLPSSKDFGAAVYNYAEAPTQIFTLVAYGEISDLAVNLQEGALSNFEISDIQTEETGNGGYLVKVSVKPKDGLSVGTHSDRLILSGKNQEKEFSIEATVSYVVREASNDATLKEIKINDEMLLPEFDANVTEYAVNVAEPTITITGTTNHFGAMVDNVTDYSLDFGANEITITVTAEDGITIKIYTITVTRATTTTDIADVFATNLNIYPNPFRGTVRLVGAEGCVLQVTNPTGTVVYTQKISNSKETLQLEHLPTGMYFFQLKKDGKVKTLKIIKE